MSTLIELGTEKDRLIKNIDKLRERLGEEEDGEHDILVGQLFNYCLKKCEKDKKLEYMMMVTALLPYYTSDSYESPMNFLKKQLTYIEFPSEFLDKQKKQNQKFTSTREHLWSYKFHHYKFPSPEAYQFSVPKWSESPKYDRLCTSFRFFYVS